MLGHLGLAEAESIHDLADRGLAERQRLENLTPAAVSQGVEHIGRGRQSSHGLASYIRIYVYVNGVAVDLASPG